MSCFIVKTGITGAIYSINNNGKQAVVAFKTKQQAATYKRLVNEMNNLNHNNKFKVENTNINYMIRSCNMTAVDLVIFEEDNTTTTYFAETNVTDEIRFHLENKYRYGV